VDVRAFIRYLFSGVNMICPDDRPNNLMGDSRSRELCDVLEHALLYPSERQELLRQSLLLREILNDRVARGWLHQQALASDVGRRAKVRNLIVQIMQASGGIWAGGGCCTPDQYDEALSRMWEWLSQRWADYDPAIASYTTWFNRTLRFRILDVVQDKKRQQEIEIRFPEEMMESFEDQPAISPRDLETLAVPPLEPDEGQGLMKEMIELAEQDPKGTLRKRWMQQPNGHVSAQELMIKVLKSVARSGEIEWEKLQGDLRVDDVKKLQNYYRNSCRPIFQELYRREFGQES
jgi:hypothetical protein